MLLRTRGSFVPPTILKHNPHMKVLAYKNLSSVHRRGQSRFTPPAYISGQSGTKRDPARFAQVVTTSGQDLTWRKRMVCCRGGR